ncbi:MAG: TrkH family potassium uptake protein [Ruminococcus sp.]
MKKRHLTPMQAIALGFAFIISIGTVLLMLPISQKPGIDLPFHDALFTSTSAVCVTGLIIADTADTFTAFGQTVLGVLIQIGGLGITTIGLGFITMAGRKIRMRDKVLLREALNYPSMMGLQGLIKWVLLTTFTVEAVGAFLSFFVFVQDHSFWHAVGISIFHSIASFNNAGFDILGAGKGLSDYAHNIPLNLITAALIIAGGLGFYVISEAFRKRSIREWSLHTKTVVLMTVLLITLGTILLKITEGSITWLEAFFTSVSTRTAGFSTYPIGAFSNAGLLVMMVLMLIGAAPGSTGGGIKVTTIFTIFRAIIAYPSGRSVTAFKRKISSSTVHTAFTVFVIALTVVFTCALTLSIFEPDIPMSSLLYESFSAYATVGLSTGITADLCLASKICIIVTMYMGRLGSLTIVSLFAKKHTELTELPEGQLPIG